MVLFPGCLPAIQETTGPGAGICHASSLWLPGRESPYSRSVFPTALGQRPHYLSRGPLTGALSSLSRRRRLCHGIQKVCGGHARALPWAAAKEE